MIHTEKSFIAPLYSEFVVEQESKLKRAKKKAIALAAMSFVFLLALPIFAVPTDAAAVLDYPDSARVEIGTAFYIDARGEGNSRESSEGSRVLTSMHLEFEVSARGERGVLFIITSGSFVANYTHYELTDGIGAAGRPQEGRFNKTIVFIFRFNMTGPNGEIIQAKVFGFVKRTQDYGPVLVMGGSAVLDGIDYAIRQLGRIHRA